MCRMASELTEIVEPTGRGRVFDMAVRGGLADAAPSGRVRLDAIAGWRRRALTFRPPALSS